MPGENKSFSERMEEKKGKWDKDVAPDLAQKLDGVVSRAKEGLKNLGGRLSGFMSKISQGVKNAPGLMYAAVTVGTEMGGEAVKANWAETKQGWKESIDNKVQTGKDVVQGTKDAIGAGKEALSADWEKTKQGWSESIDNKVQMGKDALAVGGEVLEGAKDAIKQGKHSISEAWKNDWQKTKNGWEVSIASKKNRAENAWEKIGQIKTSFLDRLREGRDKAVASAKETRDNIKSSILGRLEGGAKAVESGLSGLAMRLLEKASKMEQMKQDLKTAQEQLKQKAA